MWNQSIGTEFLRSRIWTARLWFTNLMGKSFPKGQIESRPPQTAWKALEEKYGEAYHKWWSPEIRLKDMDRHGWDIQVLLPTGSNGNFGPRAALKDSEIGAALSRAYNNWAYDYCAAAPKRLKFIAVIISTDIDEMLAEGHGRLKNWERFP